MQNSDSHLQSLVAAELPAGVGFVVGLSGGMDSVVLLHVVKACLGKSGALRALHVNHGLRKEAGEWEEFCRDLCRRWDVPLGVRAPALPERGASLENRARIARYEAFSKDLAARECLLLAHHLDDQMETLLLRLARGAGTRGLSGIPARRALGEGTLARPLLTCPRSTMAEYAAAHDLRWVEDASNRDTGFDRNFTRHEVLPLIERRWPDFRHGWERSRRLTAESREMLEDLAALDLEHCVGATQDRLSIAALRQLSAPRLHNVLRHWVEQAIGGPANPRKLRELPRCLIAPKGATDAVVDFGGHTARRFGEELCLVPDLPPVETVAYLVWDPSREPELELPGNGSLRATPANGAGLAANRYEIRYRRGGESCRLARRRARPLKKILHEARVEPWLRGRLPLLFHNNQLAAIPGIGATEPATSDPGYDIHWVKPDRQCGRDPAAQKLAD